MGSANVTSYYGPVKNPWKGGGRASDLVPGGSSGGSTAAVAARHLCSGAIGTDTGGSIRQPASFCGVVGHQAHLRALFALGHRRLRLVPGPGRSPGPHRARRRHRARRHGRPRRKGFHLGPYRSCPTSRRRLSAGVKRPQGGHPRGNTRHGRHGRRNRPECGRRAASEWLKKSGAEIGGEVSLPHTKYALPAYYIVAPAEASSNLARYDGVRYGLRIDGRQPGRDVRKHPWPPASGPRCAGASSSAPTC